MEAQREVGEDRQAKSVMIKQIRVVAQTLIESVPEAMIDAV